ncbi:MAG: hypothetical protein IJM48_01370 [Treponema sp.]|nr:hypothetical protein [Treponema sp.]
MGKMILFAGKEFPAGNDMASGASFQGRKVIATNMAAPVESEGEGENEANAQKSGGVLLVNWNRSSPLSCRSLALKCENEGGLDEAVLVFDEFYLATKYREVDNNAQILEELIASYQYLAQELIARFNRQPERQRKLIFLYKSNFSLADAINSSTVRALGIELSNPLIASAAGAFQLYAENMAAKLAAGGNITPILVSCDSQNDLSKRDSSLSVWLCEYMDSIDALKKPLSPKQKVSWVKAGAKNPSGFGILGF